jgi:alkanesulfonate monooxygenase SsuD/methylene tetrahydromethanopterin reductase-like flavin-dependent oxidoreductase (luciferase family)
LADGIYSNARMESFLRQVQWLEDECDKIGRDPAQLRIVHYSVMLPGESAEDAWARYLDHVWQMTWKYSDMEDSASRPGPPPPAPPLTDDMRDLAARNIIAGSGEEIVTTLLGIRERSDLEVEFAARSYFPTLDYETQVELMEQLAEEVAPRL